MAIFGGEISISVYQTDWEMPEPDMETLFMFLWHKVIHSAGNTMTASLKDVWHLNGKFLEPIKFKSLRAFSWILLF